MNADRLWAKRWNQRAPPAHVLLGGHFHDAVEAAGKVLDATVEDQLRALSLKPADLCARFRRIGLFAAALHDLGRANDHFQGMMTGRGDARVARRIRVRRPLGGGLEPRRVRQSFEESVSGMALATGS